MNITDIDDINYKNHQLLLKKIDELESKINQGPHKDILYEKIKLLERNVDRLTSNEKKCWEGYNDLSKQIDDIEKELDMWRTLGSRAFHPQKPHKCPVCEGNRKELNIMPNGGYFESECKSCEGKGIVWG